MSPAYWDSGVMVREPSWHKMEKAVLDVWPGFLEARQIAGLTWEPRVKPVYALGPEFAATADGHFTQIAGYQAIYRDDTDTVLAVQPASYAVIGNSQLGEIIDTIVGDVSSSDTDPVTGEALFAIQGGRQVVCLLRFLEPLALSGVDPSQTFRYLSFSARHDGQGGLRVRATNVREQCANTVHASEMDARRFKSGFVIRHTSNWESRIDDLREKIAKARLDADAWTAVATKLAGHRVNSGQTSRFIGKFLPVSSAMNPREAKNAEKAQETVRTILAGSTCEHIRGNAYGLVMAATEYADHYRKYRSKDTYVNRQLLNDQPLKARAVALGCQLAGVTVKEAVSEH